MIFKHIFLECSQALGYGMLIEEDKDARNFTVAIGEYVVFNCHLDFPHEIPIPYILHWNRDVSILSDTNSTIIKPDFSPNPSRLKYFKIKFPANENDY